MTVIFQCKNLFNHKKILMFFFIFAFFRTDFAFAQSCGTDYVVKKGDTLTSIAQQIYGDPHQWMMIFYANQDRLGSKVSLLNTGLALRVPCIGEIPEQKTLQTASQEPVTPALPSKFMLSKLVKRVEFLTAEGYEPFTGRSLPNGGMVTDMLATSMELIRQESNGKFDYGVSWVNDWGSHLNPLLSSRAFDVGFPWQKPDCDEPDELDAALTYRCQKFFFSDPLYEIFEIFYVRNNSAFKFTSDDDVVGKRICLTIDNGVDDLDGDGRNWVKDNKVTLIRPASLQECFRFLDQKALDAVVAPELTGRAIVASLGMADRVMALPRPLNIQTIHAIVSKTHPQARTLLYYVNAALARLREDGEYDRLVEKHLTHFWTTYEPQKSQEGTASITGDPPKNSRSEPEESETAKPPKRGTPDPKTSQAQR
jgi:polar amino acid transport system substrate-binding protein